MSVNYVVTTWGGERRDKSYDPVVGLCRHFVELDKRKHSLDQITLVVAKDSESGSTDFRKLCFMLGRRPGVVRLERTNDGGWSYGSLVAAWWRFRDQFSHYIFIEDDYVFVQDNFDEILIEALGNDDCCFGHVVEGRFPRHAACSVGIVTAEAFKRIERHYGHIPYMPQQIRTTTGRKLRWPQVAFSRGMIEAGSTMGSLGDCGWACPMWITWQGNKRCRLKHYNDHRKMLYSPIQAME